MSWLLNLYETYESNADLVGKVEKKHNDQEYTLLPVSHTTQNAHIEVLVTEEGEFHSASVVNKNDMSTLIPCTEDAANRAGSKIAPYPLHDKLCYVAGDYVAYGGEVKKGELFPYYMEQLKEWVDSPYATAKVKSIYGYLRNGSLVRDLVKARVLFADTDLRLFDNWDSVAEALHGSKPPVYVLVPGDPGSAFVRFNVYSPDRLLTDVWKDKEMYDSFIAFYSGKLGHVDLCFVSGKRLPATDKHTNKIRNAADKAKLISANDNSGFTFRGRFRTSLEAASISYEVSQKAHNALKWLINRQGIQMDQRVFLVWGNEELDIPGVTEDLFSISPTTIAIKEKIVSTNREFAGEVAKAFAGYRNRLSSPSKAKVNILVLDSATTGRMAVLYYRNIDKELYLDRLVKWHSSCAWLHRYRKDEDGNYMRFFGAPATKDIAYAAYGPRVSDKIVKGLMERMLPCIIDERKIPSDIVASAVQRASNPISMERWEWEKTLSITCALINRQEGQELSLDADNNDRDYLFGRLLAIADVLERRALGRDEQRESNAMRYMSAFSKHPARTWRTIYDSLRPYQARLGAKGTYYSKIIDEIGSRMPIDAFNNKPLSDLYLLGFYSQRHDLYQSKTNDADDVSN